MRILYITVLLHSYIVLTLGQMHPHSTFRLAYPIALEGALEAHGVLAVRHLEVMDGRHECMLMDTFVIFDCKRVPVC